MHSWLEQGKDEWGLSLSVNSVLLWWLWGKIYLPMQETRVRSLGQENSTCHGATKPMCHNF